MTVASPPRSHLIAVILAVFASLIGRSWLHVKLLADGLQKDYAADLSYLVVPPILLLLLLPLYRFHKPLVRRLVRPRGLTFRMFLNAIAIGVLLRLSSWCKLVAGISFGFYQNTDPGAVAGPSFSFNCSPPQVVILGVIVMVMMVPFIEEMLHRGVIQTWLAKRGPVIAILLSSLLFMLLHRQSSWGFAFFAGLVFGIQFWRSKTIWYSVTTHATVNGLIQLDWRCLHGRWNPPTSEIPLWSVGLISLGALLLAVLTLLYLLLGKNAGIPEASRR